MWIDDERHDEWFEGKTYDELVNENYKLKQQLKELEEFRDRMINATTNVTNEWVKVLLSGELKFK